MARSQRRQEFREVKKSKKSRNQRREVKEVEDLKTEVEQVEDVTVLHFSGAYWENVISLSQKSYGTSRTRNFKKFGRMIEDSKLCDTTEPDFPGKIWIIQ